MRKSDGLAEMKERLLRLGQCLIRGTYRLVHGLIGFCVRHVQLAVVLLVLLGGLVLWGMFRSCDKSPVAVNMGFDKHIDLTPEEITRIENIGQWEFLSVSTEEMVDTLQRGFLADSRLVRIYRGTLRIGVDLHKAGEGWVQAHGDTAVLRLPSVQLLDNNFIDEANTRSFYEKGQWNATAREVLYQRARRQMTKRCLTPQNFRVAEDNARAQFSTLFKSLGFNTVEISFDKK